MLLEYYFDANKQDMFAVYQHDVNLLSHVSQQTILQTPIPSTWFA